MHGPQIVKLLVGVYWRDDIYTWTGSMEQILCSLLRPKGCAGIQ